MAGNVVSIKKMVEQRAKEMDAESSSPVDAVDTANGGEFDKGKNMRGVSGGGSGSETNMRGGSDGGEIKSDFVMECLHKNELGDAELFKKLYRGDFIFNKSMDAWMSWAGHHWQLDKMNCVLASVEGVASVYQDAAKKIAGKINKLTAEDKPVNDLPIKQKMLNRRVTALRTKSRRSNCLGFVHTSADPMAIDGSEIDQKPWLLPCANGVIDLKTGELLPGRQKDFLWKASPVEYPENGIKANCELWEKTLFEIFSGNQNLVDFFRRVCGYAIVGEVSESILVVMTGRGRNGKSMIVETISKVLGPLAGAIRSEMLLDQYRISSSAGPTPDIMALRGLRMAFASETDDGCKISPSRVKWLTGNDTITGRNPHDKYEVCFKPSHTLFLLTNHKPHAPADDFAFWERMILFPFDLSFVNREPKTEKEIRADPLLGKKLEKELPSILSWIVRGCLEWQKDGMLVRPAVINEAVNDYKRGEDSVGDFIDECCVVGPEYKVRAADVYAVFEEWWAKNVSKRVPVIKRFGKWFGKRFERVKSGVIWYHGVGLLEDYEDCDQIPDGEWFNDDHIFDG